MEKDDENSRRMSKSKKQSEPDVTPLDVPRDGDWRGQDKNTTEPETPMTPGTPPSPKTPSKANAWARAKGDEDDTDTIGSLCSKMEDLSGHVGMLPPPPRKSMKLITVVLDMDETLLHSEFETLNNSFRQSEDRKVVGDAKVPDMEFIMKLDGGARAERVRVFKRPGLDSFLEWLHEKFEIVVFTAAIPEYASPVLDFIDPKGRIAHRLYRSSTCTFNGQPYVKDISQLGRAMERVVLVDNNPLAMIACPDNAIPIASYFDEDGDRELQAMAKLLSELLLYPDVRPFLRKKFGFRKLVNAHFRRRRSSRA
eukprot:CAMPEP_0170199306 /NCGR_PEP_ID=MMETSP0040_2-20121228/69266_1 /TAXON_ID=641309 /ORGANISM="Lotharella oceanica, Strain CCMP622" /LENGTH=309 /DNA_ID=CAMNT_0010449413 /DNA_START=2971 /DNA_END=3900 /DNA_ORIENTATION=-